MKKLLLSLFVALLLFIPTSFASEFYPVTTTADGISIYIDNSSVRKTTNNNLAEIWLVYKYPNQQVQTSKVSFIRSERQYAIMEVYIYDSKGNLLNHLDFTTKESGYTLSPIPPYSFWEKVYDLIW